MGGCGAEPLDQGTQLNGTIDRPTYTKLHQYSGAVQDDGTFTNPVPTSLFGEGQTLDSGVYRFQNPLDSGHVIRLEVDGAGNFVGEGHEFR